jgi:uncharacterized heparinase superfamily protein
VPFIQHEPWNTTSDLNVGRFTFLNKTAPLGWLPEWEAEDQSLLWRFNLHYFHYLHLLQVEEQQTLCRHWMDTFPDPHPVAWHPYPTSLRIRNWCLSGVNVPDVLQSLYQQAAFLHSNVETHVYGNHLLENARALVLAGAYFAGQGEADAWMQHGLAIFRDQTPEQILPDGFHYERSPMYHALMLEAYLDVLNVLPDDHADREYLSDTSCRMGDALSSMLRPDGKLMLFNDSTQEIAPAPSRLLSYLTDLTGYTAQTKDVLPATGYFGHRSDAVTLMVDAGAVGPPYLMAHAHADIFSFELALGGVPFVVDPGVYTYAAGPMRSYGRSTRAHSTVTVDETDQVECWSSFRVGRRAEPHHVVCTEASGRAWMFGGQFSGYRKIIGDGIDHERSIRLETAAGRLTVIDSVTGQGHHAVCSRLQLHPEVEATQNGSEAVLQRAGVRAHLTVVEGELSMETGWYSPAFGIRYKSTVLRIDYQAALPIRLGYVLQFEA